MSDDMAKRAEETDAAADQPEEDPALAEAAADEAAQVAEDMLGKLDDDLEGELDGEVDLLARLAELEAERDGLKDRMLRAVAEAENVRKRGERERKEAEIYGGTRLARDLLTVYDNLSRALETIDDDLRAQAGPLVEGLELTQRELLNSFSRHRIARVRPEVGDRFDPQHHQAMFEAPLPGTKAGEIIQVMADGFTIGDRLLRPAQVGVSSGG